MTDIIESILDGSMDDQLDKLSDALKARKFTLRTVAESKLKFQLHPGATVRFVATVRPKYLAGKTAEVVKVNPKKVLVKVQASDFERGAMLGKTINTPLSLIELVED